MTQAELKTSITKSPTKPGVYIFSTKSGNSKNRHLYIGKASNLKNRLRSYLNTNDVRIKKMLSVADKLELKTVDSDIEALILESQLIKKHRPTFNITLRDDKQYGFVAFSKERFPKIFVTHQPHQNDSRFMNKDLRIRKSKIINRKSVFIGPFTDMGALKTTLRHLRRIFPYCTCKQQHNNFCLNYHIGKCVGFCCLKDGESKIKNQEFEEYKKNIRAIKEILSGKRKSLVKNLEVERDKVAKNGELEKAIELRDKISKLKRVFENARIIGNWKLEIGNSGEKALNISALKGLKRVLNLSNLPRRIEGYDISNIQGTNATGSMVVFENGIPNKNEYRIFKIRIKNTPDDTFMLNEVLQRRFKRTEWPFPNLILVDGGKGQLNVALSVLATLNISIPVIAISKNKHHLGHQVFIPGRKLPLELDKPPFADKNLLLAIDAEAHRFAIGYYRKLHRTKLKFN